MNDKILLDFSRVGAVDTIGELKECKDPLVVFGAGLMAELVMDALRKHDIHYGAVCVDGWNNGSHETENIYGWDEINNKYDTYSVIIAHAPDPERIESLKKNKKIHKIYFFHSYDIKLFDADTVATHMDKYQQIFDLLEDMYSRKCLVAFLNTKISGDMQYIFEVFKEKMTCFVNPIWSITENESFWDIGAYTGNLIQQFITVSKGKYHQVVALEPDKESFQTLDLSFGRQNRIFTFNYGAWSEKGYHAFVTDIGHKLCVKCAMEDETGSNQLACISLDELLEESPQLSNPTLLRFNYGTGVVEALRGAAKILKTSQPKLAISIGFDEIGFVNIIHEIRKHNPNYKFYIRFQRCIASAINLYALVPSQD